MLRSFELTRRISTLTRFALVLGDPIAHSISPRLHNACFQALQMDACYLAVRTTSKELPDVLRELSHSSCWGINLTLPLKEKAVEYLDEVDEWAGKIGAVNTVVFRQGRTIGFNTDAKAFADALLYEAKFSFKGKRIVILGAGGAARACIYSMAISGAREIVICNRRLKKALGIVQTLCKQFPQVRFATCPFVSQDLEKSLCHADLLVNATSIGRNLGDENFLPIPWEHVSSKVLWMDLGYDSRTALEQFADRAGQVEKRKFFNGLEMLVRQAAASFSLWTGKPEPLEIMRDTAREILSSRG